MIQNKIHSNLSQKINAMFDHQNPGGGPPHAGTGYQTAGFQNPSGPGGPPRSAQKYQKRVEKILNRLNDMQIDIEKDKQGKLMTLDKQLGQTDGSLIQW